MAYRDVLRYWRTSPPPISNVLFCSVQFGRNSRHAHPGLEGKTLLLALLHVSGSSLTNHHSDYGHDPLASCQPISQCRHQQCQREQILPSQLGQDRSVLYSRRHSVMLCRCWPQRSRPAPDPPPTLHPLDPLASYSLRRRRLRRCPQRLSHACRGDAHRHRRVSRAI